MPKPPDNAPVNALWASFWERVFRAYDEMQEEAKCQAEAEARPGPEG